MACDFIAAYEAVFGRAPDFTNDQTRAFAALYFRGVVDGSTLKPRQVIIYYTIALRRYANSKNPEKIVQSRMICECSKVTHEFLHQIETTACNDVEDELQHRKFYINSMAVL